VLSCIDKGNYYKIIIIIIIINHNWEQIAFENKERGTVL
jgi:hypothetical protein